MSINPFTAAALYALFQEAAIINDSIGIMATELARSYLTQNVINILHLLDAPGSH
jgi:hypothetical protein